MNGFWIRVILIICIHIRSGSSILKNLDGGVVYMGSSDVSYITRMGSIRLRNHDGSIRVLTDVR